MREALSPLLWHPNQHQPPPLRTGKTHRQRVLWEDVLPGGLCDGEVVVVLRLLEARQMPGLWLVAMLLRTGPGGLGG